MGAAFPIAGGPRGLAPQVREWADMLGYRMALIRYPRARILDGLRARIVEYPSLRARILDLASGLGYWMADMLGYWMVLRLEQPGANVLAAVGHKMKGVCEGRM